MTYFNEQKAKPLAFQAEIARIDRKIDALANELYGFREDIKNVEGGKG